MNFVIGDLHGNLEAFQKALSISNFNPWQDRIFITGDLINRGPDSDELLSMVKSMRRDDCAYMCMGNHELALLSNYVGNPLLNDAKIKQMGGTWWTKLSQSKKDSHYEFLKSLAPHMIFHDDQGRLCGMCHARPPQFENNELSNRELAECIQYTGIESNRRLPDFYKYFVGHNKVNQPGKQSSRSNVYYMDARGGPVLYSIEADQWLPTDVTPETRLSDGAAFNYAELRAKQS